MLHHYMPSLKMQYFASAAWRPPKVKHPSGFRGFGWQVALHAITIHKMTTPPRLNTRLNSSNRCLLLNQKPHHLTSVDEPLEMH